VDSGCTRHLFRCGSRIRKYHAGRSRPLYDPISSVHGVPCQTRTFAAPAMGRNRWSYRHPTQRARTVIYIGLRRVGGVGNPRPSNLKIALGCALFSWTRAQPIPESAGFMIGMEGKGGRFWWCNVSSSLALSKTALFCHQWLALGPGAEIDQCALGVRRCVRRRAADGPRFRSHA